MVTESQKEDVYHIGIGNLLRATYLKDFSKNQLGKCKRKYPTFNDWYKTLSQEQRKRVDYYINKRYQCLP